jgi:hypothetical protein
VTSICASVPVFWPLITDSIGDIFVTKEVQIIHEDPGDEVELRPSRRESGGGTFDRNGSDYMENGDRELLSPAEKWRTNFKKGIVNPFAGEGEENGVSTRTYVISEGGTRNKWAVAHV